MGRGFNALAAVVLAGGLAACGDDDDLADVGPPPPEAVAEAEFFTDPAEFVGERVQVAGEVHTILHDDAFTLIPEGDAIDEGVESKLLVVHSGDLNVSAGRALVVTGTPHLDFDPEIEPYRDIFAEQQVFQPFVDQPYLVADALDEVAGRGGLYPDSR